MDSRYFGGGTEETGNDWFIGFGGVTSFGFFVGGFDGGIAP